MAAATVCSDFGAQENKNLSLFPTFPVSLPWSNGPGCLDLSFLNVELIQQYLVLNIGIESVHIIMGN